MISKDPCRADPASAGSPLFLGNRGISCFTAESRCRKNESIYPCRPCQSDEATASNAEWTGFKGCSGVRSGLLSHSSENGYRLPLIRAVT